MRLRSTKALTLAIYSASTGSDQIITNIRNCLSLFMFLRLSRRYPQPYPKVLLIAVNERFDVTTDGMRRTTIRYSIARSLKLFPPAQVLTHALHPALACTDQKMIKCWKCLSR